MQLSSVVQEGVCWHPVCAVSGSLRAAMKYYSEEVELTGYFLLSDNW